MRLDMTKAWIAGYVVLILITVLGSYMDYRTFTNMSEYHDVVELFKSIWPEQFAKMDEDSVDIGVDKRGLR